MARSSKAQEPKRRATSDDLQHVLQLGRILRSALTPEEREQLKEAISKQNNRLHPEVQTNR